jgi:hypothetical protein
MELIGQALATFEALAIAAGVAIVALIFRPFRRLAPAVFLTPPSSVFLFFVCRWATIDRGAVCGPDPEWDRCPTIFANIAGWIAWGIGTVAIAFGFYWLQQLIRAGFGLWFDSETKPLRLDR